MASIISWFNTALGFIVDHTDADAIDWENEADLKFILLDDTYAGNRDDDFVDDTTGADMASHEITGVAGYSGGVNGSGRKAVGTPTISVNKSADRVEFDAVDITWTALGTGATIGAIGVIREKADDLDSLVVLVLNLASTPTNGSDITVSFDSSGLGRIGTV